MIFSSLQSSIGYTFREIKHLKEAFTHKSYLNEQRGNEQQSYERLEFLGDAIWQLVISNILFFRDENFNEGTLTKIRSQIISEKGLVKIALEYRLGDYIRLSRGEELTGGETKPSILADVTESLIGAVYTDSYPEHGIQQAHQVIQRLIKNHITTAIEEQDQCDYKSQLQTLLQKSKPHQFFYKLESENGPKHNKEFSVSVVINGDYYGIGNGSTKKKAEMLAARQTLHLLNAHVI